MAPASIAPGSNSLMCSHGKKTIANTIGTSAVQGRLLSVVRSQYIPISAKSPAGSSVKTWLEARSNGRANPTAAVDQKLIERFGIKKLDIFHATTSMQLLNKMRNT